MNDNKVEGIVLKTIPFKETDRILTLFSKEDGVMSLYVRGLSKKKPLLTNLTSPFCHGEFVFRKGRSDLHRFLEGTILDLHLPLRTSYSQLEWGGKMLQSILDSQMPGKASPSLFLLVSSFLKKLPDIKHPETAWASFQLKLLKYEGILSLSEKCLVCKETSATTLIAGESRCVDCAKELSFSFSKKEWEILCLLCSTRQFEVLETLQVPKQIVDFCLNETMRST